MNINGIRSRLNRAVAKMPPHVKTRQEIDAGLIALGIEPEPVWRLVVAEGVGPYQLRQMWMKGTLRAAIDRYRGMTGSYHQKAQ